MLLLSLSLSLSLRGQRAWQRWVLYRKRKRLAFCEHALHVCLLLAATLLALQQTCTMLGTLGPRTFIDRFSPEVKVLSRAMLQAILPPTLVTRVCIKDLGA